jgi:hypothetical protein
MLAQPQATVEITKEIVQTPPLLFMAGLMAMTAGLAIVLVHNVWSGGALPVIVTLFGWAALTKGVLLLLLSPETEARVFIVGLHYDQHPYPYALFLLLLGAYLTYAAFHSETRSPK